MGVFKSMVGSKMTELLSLPKEEKGRVMKAIFESSKNNTSKVVIIDKKPIKVTSYEDYYSADYNDLIDEIVKYELFENIESFKG